jgi:hypothetical protein
MVSPFFVKFVGKHGYCVSLSVYRYNAMLELGNFGVKCSGIVIKVWPVAGEFRLQVLVLTIVLLGDFTYRYKLHASQWAVAQS